MHEAGETKPGALMAEPRAAEETDEASGSKRVSLAEALLIGVATTLAFLFAFPSLGGGTFGLVFLGVLLVGVPVGAYFMPLPRDRETVSWVEVWMALMVTSVVIRVGIIVIQAVIALAGTGQTDESVMNNEDEVHKLVDKQREDLSKYELVDSAKGEAMVPVERAMELVVKEAKANAPSLVPSVGAHDKPTMPADMAPADGESELEGMVPAGDDEAAPSNGGGVEPPAAGAAPPGAPANP